MNKLISILMLLPVLGVALAAETAVVSDPGGGFRTESLLIESHDMMDYMGPDLNAEIWLIPLGGGTPSYTGHNTPYAFASPGDFVPGTYYVIKDGWGDWIPENMVMEMLWFDYSVDFMGFYYGPGASPQAPENLAVNVDGDDILITWDPVTEDTDNQPITPDGYNVYAAGQPDGDFIFLGASNVTQFLDIGAAGELPAKFYRVMAVMN